MFAKMHTLDPAIEYFLINVVYVSTVPISLEAEKLQPVTDA